MNALELAAAAAEGKYAFLCPDTVAAIAAEEAPKYKKDKDCIKAVKRRLHMLCGAFEDEGAFKIARKALEEGEPNRRLLSFHGSTRERLPFIEPFCEAVEQLGEYPETVADIGCGFLPVASEYFPKAAKKYGFDIDRRITDFVNAYFRQNNIHGEAGLLDICAGLPPVQTDCVCMFKLLPLLEQRKKGMSFQVMAAIPTRRFVVSFPCISLSGRDKGMAAFYADFFEKGVGSEFIITGKTIVGNELIYGCRKKEV